MAVRGRRSQPRSHATSTPGGISPPRGASCRESLLFQVSALDPTAFLAACGSMTLVGMLATLLPANRAACVDATVLQRSLGYPGKLRATRSREESTRCDSGRPQETLSTTLRRSREQSRGGSSLPLRTNRIHEIQAAPPVVAFSAPDCNGSQDAARLRDELLGAKPAPAQAALLCSSYSGQPMSTKEWRNLTSLSRHTCRGWRF